MLGAGNQHRTRDCTVLAVFLADLQASLRISRIQQLEQEQLLLQKMSTPANAATGTSLRHPNYLATLPVTASFLLGEGHAATLLKQVATDILSAAQQQPMPDIETASTWAYKNTALCVQTFLLAATAHNLATCTMEGYDGRRMRDVLRIPDRYGIPMVVATGTAYRESSHDNNNGDFDHKEPETNHPDGWRTPRLPLEEVVFTDTFGETLPWEKEDN